MAEYHDTFLDGNELIEAAIDRYYRESSKETLIAILDTIRQRMHADGHFIFPVLVDEEDESRFDFRTIQTKDGKIVISSPEEEEASGGENADKEPVTADSEKDRETDTV